jgi:hypothetical protein
MNAMTKRTRLSLICATPLLIGVLSCSSQNSSEERRQPLEAQGGGADEPSEMNGGSRDPRCINPDSADATANCLTPSLDPAYYVAQAESYFDTLDIDAPRESVPLYHVQVARWEWPPWLLLTGYGAEDMITTGDLLRAIDPSTVPVRDCRFFERQPFARCYVEFEYHRGRCPIYEEFTFNQSGEMTFIEAWSNLPDLLPEVLDDPWAEASDFPRLSTRIPGLGSDTGSIDLESDAMREVAMRDADVADFATRATDWGMYWREALGEAEPDFFGVGCGWPPEEGSQD